MALSLTAEQKYIIDIFSGKEQYIIPPYQRPYSWDEEQCSELLEDLKNAYLKNKDDGYFLGNIVIAKSNQDKYSLEVIDGQQRLITLTLLIKVLLKYNNDSVYLKNAIFIPGKKLKDIAEQRLKTNVFEDKDSKYLNEVINENISDICPADKKNNNFKKNICYFYTKIEELDKNFDKEDFSDFLLENVSLLPIETEDNDKNKAREKALKIFETINNRGMSLSDADIFKANLYSMALEELQQDDFIDNWKKLDKFCDDIGYSIERIFKIYSYQIRGLNELKSSEIGLRDFFSISYKYSPFKTKKYNEIMDDLFAIVDSAEFFHIIKQSNGRELPKWFQLIDIYTNNYPKDLIIVYLAKNIKLLNEKQNDVIKFSKNLVRYCYFRGATTNIKNDIYKFTIDVMNDNWKEFYPKKNYERTFQYFGRLYKGYGLLGAYLNPKQTSVFPYYIKRMRDIVDYWNDDYCNFDIIGNTIATDLSKKELYDSSHESKFIDINSIKINLLNWNDNTHQERQKELEKRFINFFMGK